MESPAFVNVTGDQRFHAAVEIEGERFIGLLDSGAEVTVVGPRFQAFVASGRIRTKPSMFNIRTADGAVHATAHVLILNINYLGHSHVVEAPMLPSLKHDLVLGVDFWLKFNIRPAINEVCTIEAEKQLSVSEHMVLSDSEAVQLKNVLNDMPFGKPGILSKTTLTKHAIDTGCATPIKQTQYIISPYVQKEVHAEIDRLLSIGAIFPCSSAWNNPMICVRKPNGKVRLCLDARKLNAVTAKDAYPQPQLNRILAQLSGTHVLSSIDFSDAYHQVELEDDAKLKTAFSISGKGFFAYSRMPFGLCNSGATLCRLVDRVLGCDLEPHVFVYLDDVIIATNTLEHHFELLSTVADRLTSAGLTISAEKSRFCMKRLKYLGHIIGEGNIAPDSSGISAIVEYPQPTCAKDIRRLLGMAGWYRRFIPNFATLSAPLSDLLKKGSKFAWTDAARKAFDDIKEVLISAPVLASPNYELPFTIQTDASDSGIGGVLVQGVGESERAVAYFSQKLSAAQRKYQTTERECLAVIVGIEKFRAYVEGAHFTVVTDHASLQWLQNLKDPSGRLGRWALRLQPYNFTLTHRAGRLMVVADALSRAVELIDVQSFPQSTDKWYVNLVAQVQKDPDKFPQYRCEEEILYKHCSYGARRFDGSGWRVVVPADRRKDVLVRCHDDPLSAHGGRHKTIDRVSRHYYWPRMYEHITRYVHDCGVCRASKSSNIVQRAPMGKRIEADRPWQVLYVDFVGPLPRSKGGFTYLLVVVDSFSKYVHIHPARLANAKCVMKFLEQTIFLTFGVPDRVVSDNGSQFVSREYKSFLEKYRVETFYVSRYHPQANAAEAANKTIGTAIRSYVTTNHRDWDCYIRQIACAMNTSVHSSTGMSPYFVNFGRHMVTAGRSDIVNEEVERNEEHFRTIRETVARNLSRSHEASKKRYDLRSRPVEYVVGEKAWKKTFPLSDASRGFMAKLAPKYQRCVVVNKIGLSSYELADEYGKRLGTFSAKDMKKN